MNINQDKFEKIIYFIGFCLVGWIIKLFTWITKKTKWLFDDSIADKIKEMWEKSKK